MRIPISEAKSTLTDLVRRAEAGEEIVLTRHGSPAVRLVPVRRMPDPAARRTLLEAARRAGAAKAQPEADAARSADFLYDQNGLPR